MRNKLLLLLALAWLSTPTAWAGWPLASDAAAAPRTTWTTQLAADGTRLTLAWGTGAENTAGHAWNEEGSAVSGVLSIPLSGPFTLHANLGGSKARFTGQRNAGWALALERAGNHRVDIMAELFDDDRTRHPWAQVGLRWVVVPGRLTLDARYGTATAGPHDHAVTLGARIAF